MKPTTIWRLAMAALAGACLTVRGAPGELPAENAASRQMLTIGWRLQSTVLAPEDGVAVSRLGFKTEKWHPAAVPSTVLSALVKNGVYPDPRVGLNAYQIPDSSDEFNRKHNLAKFSHLPDQRNPWRDPYWYRTEFTLPKLPAGRRVWLHFGAINYRAEVWLNGKQIADHQTMAGMFQRFQYDITGAAQAGRNALAVKVWPVDHPGEPDTQLAVLGKDRGYVGKEIMRDVTEIMTIGYDCMMTVPDRNMGLWQTVWIDFTGAVDIRHPFVVTELPLPETNRATLIVSAELVNATASPVQGILRGSIAGTEVRFEQSVELAGNETKTVVIHPKPVLHNPRLWWPHGYGEQHLYELRLEFVECLQGLLPRLGTRKRLPFVGGDVRRLWLRNHRFTIADSQSDQSLVTSTPTQFVGSLDPLWRRHSDHEPRCSGVSAERRHLPGNLSAALYRDAATKARFMENSAGGSSAVVSPLSDTERVTFGVRQVGYEMHELNGWHGRRVLINGQRIFCRGGYIQPELMFDWDARRLETELRYYAGANLNLIYFEDIPNPPEPFLELCDQFGLLFGNVFYSCFWLRPGTPYPDDFALLECCTVDLVKRYRNHPSLIFYMAMNEEDTKENVYEMWRSHLLALDGTRWFIPSAYFPSDRKKVGEWFKKDLPTGMTDKGASYSWAEPEQYFRWVREARNWMFMMESGSASLPPISSLSRFLTNTTARSAGERLFPLDTAWAHHGANQYYKGYDAALRRLHGEPESVADYCWKGHLVTADQHRSMFEAVQHRLWNVTSGFTEWKINSCEPNIQWQIFDWYLKPMVSFFYIKKACEPLHVQLNLPDRMATVVNTRLLPQPGLAVRARVFDLNARPLWEKAAKLDAPANGYREAFAIPEPSQATPVYFVKLELRDTAGRLVSDNFYWLRNKETTNYLALQSLPLVKLRSSSRIEKRGDETVLRARIMNPTDRLAFFVQVAVTDRRTGRELLPVIWEDNYFSLLPSETKEVTGHIPNWAAAKALPQFEVGGWNVETPFECHGLSTDQLTVRSGEPFTVAASIGHTFLDGSRVPVCVDGQAAVAPWVWARAGGRQELRAALRLESAGTHRVTVGRRTLRVVALP